jgi:hypothetical protein
MFVRPAEPTDYQEWLSMRAALWPEGPPEEHLTEMRDYTSGACLVAFVAGHEHLEGFVEASFAPDGRGLCNQFRRIHRRKLCQTGMPASRYRPGPIAAAEEWAISRDCAEMASDCIGQL